MSTSTHIEACRLCRSKQLVSVLDLGRQSLTGVFPLTATSAVGEGPLELLWCRDCTLLQLADSFEAAEMYGDNYGYRSGLNQSMVTHLQRKVRTLEELTGLHDGDVVLDIGSNDGTLLNAYSVPGVHRIGIDPTAKKFLEHYAEGVEVIDDFFTAEAFRRAVDRPATVVTSVAMFYDLEDPIDFARQVASCLAPDGVWHFEQSYMPSMLRATSYDTVCHEHLEYYSLATVERILREAGLRVLDVRFNRVNGGSFAVTAGHAGADRPTNELVGWFEEQEARMGLTTPVPFREFERRVFEHRQDLTGLIRRLRSSGASVLGYGASTKGNVLLQFCGLTPEDLPAIAEVNPDKFGRVTPGTGIPIVSEAEARAERPDYLLVLPWHFRESIVEREREYLAAGGRLIFPLPEIEIVGN